MKRKGMTPGLLALLAMALSLPALAQEEVSPNEATEAASSAEAMVNETPQLWFVELASPPATDGTSLTTLESEHGAFRAAARKAGLLAEERFAFKTLWNGFSLRIDPSQLALLERIDGVKEIYPVAEVLPDQVAADEAVPELATALAMTGADFAQNNLGLTGDGIRVAVMDTGIDYNHPDLGGCFGPGCRVATGWDFVGDAFSGPASTPVPDPDPDDCNGHGTHVSGIVGASPAGPGGVKGVAPSVTFGAYRVFGCAGSTTADIMIAAMERALADDMQVLNMSIGSAFQWPQYPTAQASDRLVNKGVAVVASIGNSGTNGLYSAGAPGLGKKVIGVASFDNSHVRLATFTITPDNMSIGYGPAAGAPAPPTFGSFLMARTGTSTTPNDACAPLPAGSLTGKVALIRRGTCTFYAKSRNAQLAGAAAVVLYNNTAGRFSPTVAGTPAVTIPVVAISGTEGVLINSRLAAGPVTMTWTNTQGSFLNPTGGLISDFSSYGLSPDLSVKPDIGAPGGLIRSTWPLEQGAYATISGTSMSSPHTAGGVALLLEARPNTPSNAVRSILQNSADPKNWWGNPGLGFLDNVHRQGAGMLDIPGAVLSTVTVEPGKLSLGESEAGPSVRTLTITNNGTDAVTFDLSHSPALATGSNTFAPSFFASFASAAFSASSVTVPAGGTATVDVTLTAPAGLANRGQYGGYIVLTPQGGGAAYRVPYAGLKGDYQSILVLNPAASGFGNPILRSSLTFGPNDPVTLTDPANNPAWVLLHLDHQVRQLRMEVFDANSGQAWHRAFDEGYVGRNSTSTGFFSLPFDGVTVNGRKLNVLPDGQYVIKLSVLKALGDAANPAHSETWTSPVITIDRP